MFTLADVTIGDARPADRAGVVRLLSRQLAEHDIELEDERLAFAVDGMLDEPARGRILVARHGEELVGVAVMSYTWTLEHGGPACWLDELYVEPRLREHGVGTRLLRAACARAEEDGRIAMDLEVEASHARVAALYLREGFHAHTRSRFVRPLRGHPKVE
jgi:GNAT superfamily N-acetyltransferase